MSKDKKKSKGLPRPDTTEIAVAQLSDRYSTHPSGGLTPKKLAEIFHEADDGDVMRQMELFEDRHRYNYQPGLPYGIKGAAR